MGNSLNELRLEDCMDAIIDYRGKTPKKTNSGIPLITAKIIKNGQIQEVKEFIAESDYESWMRRGTPEAGDVVLTTEAPLGEVAQLDDRKIALAQRVITLRGKKGLLDNDYLKYLLLSNDVQHQLDGRGTGTTVKGIKQSELREIILKFPDLSIQKSIAYILKTLDDKIELNRQTNQTLEQMAQTLFKSWFVDFDPVFDNALAAGSNVSDFPEALQQRALLRQERRKQVQQLAASPETKSKPLPEDIRSLFPSEFEQTDESSIGIAGWIPKGWKATSFESIIKLIGGGTPKTTIEEYWSGEIPWFSVVDAPNDSDVFVLDTEKHVTQLGVDKSSTKMLRKGTTIISARGTVGKCALVAEPMAMNQSCYGLNGIEGVSDEFIYFMTRHQVSDLQKRGHGSVFNTITRETFKSIILPFSGSDITQKFSKSVVPFLNKILLNNKQNVALEKTRDVLLPKLISGELTIPDSIKTENIVNHQQPKEPLSNHA
jgi:type I restriction enzyme S subunit